MINLIDKPTLAAITFAAVTSSNTRPIDLAIFVNGVSDNTSVTYLNLNSNGLGSYTFTPHTSGVYTVFGDGKVLATIDVVSRSNKSYLTNIEDEALGSWSWDKTSGILILLRQDGTQLGKYTVTDSLTTSSREVFQMA